MKRWNCWKSNRSMELASSVVCATSSKKMPINLPSSKPQANVASYLEQFRKIYLQQALSNAVQAADLRTINKELDELAPARDLRKLASRGIPGECAVAVPTSLPATPNRRGDYRLLPG